jgi:hypothetical protein
MPELDIEPMPMNARQMIAEAERLASASRRIADLRRR